ncbi:MAG: IS3 family transposase [Nannocystaceae bacterium]|nr:IS3 family transposase [Nannocystaceae bacterium]
MTHRSINAVVESFFATLKTEVGEAFDDQATARSEIGNYIDRFYNYQRLHSSLGYVSPADYEAQPRTAARAA